MAHASDPPGSKRLSWESRCEIVMKVDLGLFSRDGRFRAQVFTEQPSPAWSSDFAQEDGLR